MHQEKMQQYQNYRTNSIYNIQYVIHQTLLTLIAEQRIWCLFGLHLMINVRSDRYSVWVYTRINFTVLYISLFSLTNGGVILFFAVITFKFLKYNLIIFTSICVLVNSSKFFKIHMWSELKYQFATYTVIYNARNLNIKDASLNLYQNEKIEKSELIL